MKTSLCIEVTCDTNDADYITERSYIDEKTLKQLEPLFQAIKNCKVCHNWPKNEYTNKTPKDIYTDIDKDLIDKFDEYVPYDVHTIDDIRIIKVIEERSLLR